MPEKALSKKPQVLVVDDDMHLVRIVQRYLAAAGIETLIAAHPAEARTVLAHEPIPIVICDWNMPEEDGISFCRSLRGDMRTQSIYFIMLTANEAQDKKITALREGADDYIIKPFDSGELLARVNTGIRITTLQSEVAQLQHTRALGELAATMGHEINNPLTGLLGFIELAKGKLRKSPLSEEDLTKTLVMLDRCEEQGRRIAEVVSKLRTLKNPKLKTYSDTIRIIDIASLETPTETDNIDNTDNP